MTKTFELLFTKQPKKLCITQASDARVIFTSFIKKAFNQCSNMIYWHVIKYKVNYVNNYDKCMRASLEFKLYSDIHKWIFHSIPKKSFATKGLNIFFFVLFCFGPCANNNSKSLWGCWMGIPQEGGRGEEMRDNATREVRFRDLKKETTPQPRLSGSRHSRAR